MDKPEQQKWLDMIISMAIDCSRGGITWETFIANLQHIAKSIEIK